MHRADYLEPRKWNTVISVSGGGSGSGNEIQLVSCAEVSCRGYREIREAPSAWLPPSPLPPPPSPPPRERGTLRRGTSASVVRGGGGVRGPRASFREWHSGDLRDREV